MSDGAGGASQCPRITGIEVWPGLDATRVVVRLDRPAPYRAKDEPQAGFSSARTLIDLDGVDVGSVPHESRATGIVRNVLVEPTGTGARVTLDLDGRVWRRAFHLQDPYRVIVDVARHPPGADWGTRRALTRVVLDPGHGGRDTGAIGPTGMEEKAVTLDVAHRAAPLLALQGLQVVLTRDDDRFVSLEARTARANAFAADLFVSIHCNASESRALRGVETYVLDTTRDEIAQRLAARENGDIRATLADAASIPVDMPIAYQAARSNHFARLLQRATTTAARMSYHDVVDGGVHPAGFYVLVGARMPSVLFETSYLSNAIEESRLGQREYRQLLADAIVNAVEAYREGR